VHLLVLFTRAYVIPNLIWHYNDHLTNGLFTFTADYGLLRAITLIKHPQTITYRLSTMSADVNIFLLLHEII